MPYMGRRKTHFQKLNSVFTYDYLYSPDSPHWCSTDAAVWGNGPPSEDSPGSLVA
jgi:hypothetical protein